MTVKSFRDLGVWQAGMELVERTYLLTRDLPSNETYGLTSQMRRAAVSVPSNIAEGHARQHTKECLHHLSIAQASLAELETQFEIAARLSYFSSESVQPVLDQIVSLGRQLSALRKVSLTRGPGRGRGLGIGSGRTED